MAIVYSYEQATTPALGDLLLGTDVSASGKPTKSFSIQSIVDLVQTGVPGGGTVTSIGTNSSTFVTQLQHRALYQRNYLQRVRLQLLHI